MNIKPLLLSLIVFCLAACNQEMKNIGPQDIGIILTPTGYEQQIYPPGQVNIGDLIDGKGNSLILVQRSGVDTKEQRAIALGNPTYPNPNDQRVMRIDAISIYEAQARQQVRQSIRMLCKSYKDFDAIFNAFGDSGEAGLSKKLEHIVADALTSKKVPFVLISAGPSNIKPDEEIMQARAAKQAAQIHNEAVEIVTNFLDQDRTGSRRMVYQMQVWKEIVSIGNANGHNTIMFQSDGGHSNLIPIVNPGGKPPAPPAPPAKEAKAAAPAPTE
jgi:hypothetical protein